MDPSIVSEEYIHLQEEIIREQTVLKEKISMQWSATIEREGIDPEFPIVPQLPSTPISVSLYRDALVTILSSLSTYTEELQNDVDRCKNVFDNEGHVVSWIKESLRYNTGYFQSFADDHEISAWLPHFVAEQAIRPFLHVISKRCESFIEEMNVGGGCPCCAEPVRLKVETGNEESQFICPRCETSWSQKRKSCVHCGEEKEGYVLTLSIEEDDTSQLEVCESCKNYVKVIMKSSNDSKSTAALLDLLTLHLDYIAQEEGYGEAYPKGE
ncbi:formate dehydrogenase accessory protein FdhE [Alteribacter populi]|uniref:formate dehydrogenase accessory protein FdhE domain-containing protein n=1 Tax=Alteribacter populi TaxID=2011011 RepID=UPI0012FD4152|nr:formate dehydrogenase accessory protein FdhE [Alteribacter populi]